MLSAIPWITILNDLMFSAIGFGLGTVFGLWLRRTRDA